MTKIDKALADCSPELRDIFLSHIDGRTSAVWLQGCFARLGHDIGQTTIKDYRRKRALTGAPE